MSRSIGWGARSIVYWSDWAPPHSSRYGWRPDAHIRFAFILPKPGFRSSASRFTNRNALRCLYALPGKRCTRKVCRLSTRIQTSWFDLQRNCRTICVSSSNSLESSATTSRDINGLSIWDDVARRFVFFHHSLYLSITARSREQIRSQGRAKSSATYGAGQAPAGLSLSEPPHTGTPQRNARRHPCPGSSGSLTRLHSTRSAHARRCHAPGRNGPLAIVAARR